MNKEELKKYLIDLGFDVDDQKMKNIEDFIEKTLLTNEKFNLTAITDIDVFREKMVYDSALAIKDLDLAGKKAIDIGTGAGFPGMIIYLLNPEVKMTLLDSTAKKINYLNEYAKERDYHLAFATNRAEEYARKHIEKYDFAFARAVAPLNILLEIIMPLVKVDGYFIALKGSNADVELKEARNALKKLNSEVIKIKNYILPESKEERNILLIKKKGSTNKKYPRMYSEIKNSPL